MSQNGFTQIQASKTPFSETFGRHDKLTAVVCLVKALFFCRLGRDRVEIFEL